MTKSPGGQRLCSHSSNYFTRHMYISISILSLVSCLFFGLYYFYFLARCWLAREKTCQCRPILAIWVQSLFFFSFLRLSFPFHYSPTLHFPNFSTSDMQDALSDGDNRVLNYRLYIGLLLQEALDSPTSNEPRKMRWPMAMTVTITREPVG